MKSFRLWLLLLLAVLLPVRGALAVAMQCPAPGSQVQATAQAAVEPSMAHGDHDAHASHASHDHSGEAAHDHAAASDKCNLCAASCSAPALVGVPITSTDPRPVATVFTHPAALPQSFVSDGQERPPRTI